MEDSIAGKDINEELDVQSRFDVAKTWALGVRDIAARTRHPIAQRLWKFIDDRTTIAAPMPNGRIHYLYIDKPSHNYGYYAYLTPILAMDMERLPANDPRVVLGSGHASHIAEYDEKQKAIYLPNSDFSSYTKGILLLHEALRAWLNIKKQAKSKTAKSSRWIEEVRVFKFEFELLEIILGARYRKLCDEMALSITPLKDDPAAISISYRPNEEDEKLIAEKLLTKSDAETNLWLSVCKIHAFWLYFQRHSDSPDFELAQFLKSRANSES